MSVRHAVLEKNGAYAWDRAVWALGQTGRQKDHVFVGFQPDALFVPVGALANHVYIVGGSGSGKTSRLLAPLLEQLVLKGHPQVTLDCKWDPLLAGHVRDAAKRAGRTFRLFSILSGVPSDCAFDFFQSISAQERTPRELAEILMPSLGLDQADNPFFKMQNASALVEAFKRAARQGGKLSFKAVAHHLRDVIESSDGRFEHALQALDSLEQLADCPQLNPKDAALPPLDVNQLLQRAEACYFCVPTSLGQKALGATVSALVLKAIVLASQRLELRGVGTKKLFLCVDEFQDVASSADVGSMVAQVRGVGGGISLVLAHQVTEQLQDLGSVALLKSAGLVVLMTPRPYAAEIQQWSGEVLEWQRSHNRTHVGQNAQWTVNDSPMVRPALALNDIMEVNAAEGYGIAVVGGGMPTPTFFPHHVEQREASRRKQKVVSTIVRVPTTPQGAARGGKQAAKPQAIQPRAPRAKKGQAKSPVKKASSGSSSPPVLKSVQVSQKMADVFARKRAGALVARPPRTPWGKI